jgi:hypothetical protein
MIASEWYPAVDHDSKGSLSSPNYTAHVKPTYRQLWLVSLTVAEILQVIQCPCAIVEWHGVNRSRFLGHHVKLLRKGRWLNRHNGLRTTSKRRRVDVAVAAAVITSTTTDSSSLTLSEVRHGRR